MGIREMLVLIIFSIFAIGLALPSGRPMGTCETIRCSATETKMIDGGNSTCTKTIETCQDGTKTCEAILAGVSCHFSTEEFDVRPVFPCSTVPANERFTCLKCKYFSLGSECDQYTTDQVPGQVTEQPEVYQTTERPTTVNEQTTNVYGELSSDGYDFSSGKIDH